MKTTTKKVLSAVLASALLLSFSACSEKKASEQESNTTTPADNKTTEAAPAENTEEKVIRVGASPAPHAQILEACKDALAEKGYTLEIVEFPDYVLPNLSLDNGELEANFFQHTPYLEEFCASRDVDLVAAVKVHFEPLGIYKGQSDDFENIKDGATIAVPNDPTNEARALQLLADNGLITLTEGVGLNATVKDIIDNPKNIEILEIEAAQLPRTLPDVDFAIINGNYALDAGIIDSLLLTEDPQSDAAQTFANVLAVRKGDENTEATKALVEVLTSDATRAYIEETFGSTVVPVF